MTPKTSILFVTALLFAAAPVQGRVLERYHDTCKAKRLYAEYVDRKDRDQVRRIAVPPNESRGFVTRRPADAKWLCGKLAREFECPNRTRYIEIDRPVGARFYVSCYDE